MLWLLQSGNYKMRETNIIFGRGVKADEKKLFFPNSYSDADSRQGDLVKISTPNANTSWSTRDSICSAQDTQLHVCHRNCHTYKKHKDFHYKWSQKLCQTEMFYIIFLYCIVLLSLPFPACAQDAHHQSLGLEPSRFLIPSFSEKDESIYHQSTMLDNFNGYDLDSDWALDESCKFTATVGSLFIQSLQDEMEKRFPDDITNESEIKIHASNHIFYDWILYSKTTRTLEGVPLKRHSGVPYHFMIIAADQNAVVRKVPCLVEVEPKKSFHSASTEAYLHWKPGLNDLGCLPTETVVTLGVILDVDKEQLNAEQRVTLLQKLSSFVHTFSPAQRNSLTLETENIEEHTAFLSGSGDLTGLPKYPPGVGVYWSLGCSADSVELTGLDIIEQSARNGSLAQLLGFAVTKWRVENRKPKLHHHHDETRFRREAGLDVPKSPVVRHAGATPPSDGRKSRHNFKRHPGGVVSEDDLDSYLADERYQPLGRARIPNHMIRQSPTVRYPKATPYIPNLPKHLVPSPSSPSVPKPPSSPSSMINYPPEKNAGMEDITIHASTYFEYRVPINAFSDPEEGNTRSLSLSVISTDPLNSGEDSWLRLDLSTQVFFGIPPKKKGSSHKNSYGYLLVAEDSGGKSTTDSFAIHLTDRPKPTNHRFVMIFSKYNHSLSLPVLVSTFARHLSMALKARWHALRPPGQYTVLKVEPSKERLTISWFDNSLGSKSKCEKKEIHQLLSRMGGQPDFESFNQRFAPDPEFKATFGPTFTLKSIKSVLLGPCDAPIETTIQTIPSTALEATSTPSKGKTFIQPPIIIPPQPPITTFQPTSNKPTPKPTVTRGNFTTTTTGPKFLSSKNKPTFEYFPPFNTDPNFVMRISSSVGKVVVEQIPDFQFVGGPTPPRPNEFTLKLTANQSLLPTWVTVSSEKWSVVTLPMMSDLSDFKEANSTHIVWRGNLAAVDGYGRKTESILVEVFTPLPPLKEEANPGVTHLFQMKITNYNLQNFTLLDSVRLLSVISGLYEDQNTDNIFVHPPRAGSVIYSWHNDSLPSQDECPYMDIAKMGTVLFKGTQTKPDVNQRLLDSGFVIGSLSLKKMNSCLKKTVPTTVTSTVSSTTTTTSKSTTKIEETTSSGEDVVTLAAGGISVDLIIVIVVVICILLLVILAVVKCRSYTAEKRTSKEKKELENGNGATPIVFSPESSFLADDSRKSGLSTLERQTRFKAGTPIILEGETENRESSSPLLHDQTSTLTRQLNALPVVPSTTQENTPNGGDEHTQEDTTRPPPPPYHKPSCQHPN